MSCEWIATPIMAIACVPSVLITISCEWIGDPITVRVKPLAEEFWIKSLRPPRFWGSLLVPLMQKIVNWDQNVTVLSIHIRLTFRFITHDLIAPA